MSDFYGKRFLSSLVGALTVLGSPVASARDDKLGKGNLKGRGGASARRDKNNGKLGGLESNRKVKDVESLKKVFKETGGKVVGVSPDGKGGFVAFIKTPTGKVVTVAIVSVPLAVIIYCLVCFGRKNGEGIEGSNISIKESEKIITLGGPVEYIKAEENIKSKGNKKMTVFEGTNGSVGDDQLKYSGKLLEKLFDNVRRCNLFIEELFRVFFNDKGEMRNKFDSCKGNLDEFLRVVFEESSFGVDDSYSNWEFGTEKRSAVVNWVNNKLFFVSFDVNGEDAFVCDFFSGVFSYLSKDCFVGVSEVGGRASWGDRISALLFGFWYYVKYDLVIEDYSPRQVESTLNAKDSKKLREVFGVIREYVEDRLKAAGKDYNGQKLKKVS